MAKILFNEQELLARLDYEQGEPRTIVDVGAHIGNFSKRFGALGWRIVAFEPDPDNYAALSKRVAEFPRSRAIQKAVSDVTGQTSFYRSTEYWGIHSLKPFHPTHTDKIDVEVTRLDDALAAEGIDRVTVLKIDAEGADYLALRSFPFERIRPEVVMTEFMDERSEPQFGYDHHAVVAFMAERGYVAYVAEWAPVVAHSKKGGGGGPFYFLQCLPYPLHHAPAWGNLIFVDPGRRQMFETRLNEVLVDLHRRREAAATASATRPSSSVPEQTFSTVFQQLKDQAKRVPGARRLWRFGRRVWVRPAPTPAPAPVRPAPTSAVVTVAVADRGNADALKACLERVAAQTGVEWCCRIVVDHGRAPSLSVAQRFAKLDRRFEVIRHGAAAGLSCARKNTGARASTTPFLVLLDSNDHLLDGALDQAISVLKAATVLPSVAGVYAGQQREVTAPVKVELPFADFVSGVEVFTRAVVMRRDVFVELGGFDESLGDAAEGDFWYRLFRHGYGLLPTGLTGVAHHPPGLEDEGREDHGQGGELEFARRAWVAHQAEVELPPHEIRPGTPYVYAQPRSAYRTLAFKRRLLEDIGRRSDTLKIEPVATRFFEARDFADQRSALQPELHVALGLTERSGRPRGDAVELIGEAKALSDRVAAAAATAAPGHPPDPRPRSVRWPAGQRQIQVAFAPHKDYHAWTMSKAAVILQERGISVVFIDSTTVHRDEGARRRLQSVDVPIISYNNYRFGDFRPRVLMVMNDWETQVHALIDEAHHNGVTTVGLIEGVQDFTDADTGRQRRPYQHVRQAFLSGEFDRQFFDASTPTRVIGVPRIDELRQESCRFPDEPLVIVNSNFSYGVLTDQREGWLRSIAEACDQVGVQMVVSRHPADDGDFSRYTVTEMTMYDAIRNGSVFVSRFGSGIIEALTMGKPSIYHNPHGEKVIKFQAPMGAYAVTTSVDSLARALEREIADRTDRRPRAKAFLDAHIAWSAPGTATDRLVSALEALASEPGSL